jgi:hypothetical protein
MKLIDKNKLAEKIENRIKETESMRPMVDPFWEGQISAFDSVLKILDTFEVIDPYEECVQYASIKAGIQAHAETYSFNIESELFNQLAKEQQGLWRKEIEQACISGGEVGVELAKDPRYKENVEVKAVDLEKEIHLWMEDNTCRGYCSASIPDTAEHFFELGLKAQKKE